MKTLHQPVGKVFYLPDSYFCHSDDNFCPNSPRNDASSADVIDMVDEEVEVPIDVAIDSVDQEVDVLEPPPASSKDLLDAIDSDDDELDEPVAGNVLEVSSMASDDEELDEVTTPRRPRLVLLEAALDLCPTVDLTNLSDSDSSTSTEDESESDDEDLGSEEGSDHEMVIRRTVSVPRPPSWESDYLSVDQVDHMIRSQMMEIEAKKPWRFVFSCLEVPFNFERNEDPFDVFFMRWDEFWRVHGRAVWERDFWQPLLPGSTESHRRKGRQYKAMCAFRELATDLMARKKKELCCDLKDSLEEGWWYRTEPFRLRKLFYKNRQMYEEYLTTRVKLRWPRGKKFLVKRGLKPIWWLPDYCSPATDDESEK